MDHHKGVEGLTAEAVAEAHRKDMEIQDEYGVKYHRYWSNEDTGEIWCLAEAPNKEAAEATHGEAHGLVADEIVEVKQGSKSLQRGGSWGYGRTAGNYYGARQEPKFPRRN
jgi:hypothetical protein